MSKQSCATIACASARDYISAPVRATDAAPTSLFIFHPLLANRLKTSSLPFFQIVEEPHEYAVEPFMKTKDIFGLVTAVAVTGFTASAQAGWSVNFSFGAPVPFPPSVVVAAPGCLPPVVYCSPPVPHCPPRVVYASAACRPVVYAAPRWGPNYGYRAYPGQGHHRGQSGWHQNAHGYNQGGHR